MEAALGVAALSECSFGVREQLQQTIDQMAAAGVELTVTSYNILIDVNGKAARPQQAAQWFERSVTDPPLACRAQLGAQHMRFDQLDLQHDVSPQFDHI